MAAVTIVIGWGRGPVRGSVIVRNGQLRQARIVGGRGRIRGADFTVVSAGAARLELTVAADAIGPGDANPTMVAIRTRTNPFAFFLRDVSKANPIFIAAYGVTVTTAGDPRSPAEIGTAIRRRGLRTNLQQMVAEPEESYAVAAAATRRQIGPIWLGLSRDMRIFEMGYRPEQGYWGYINPRFHGSGLVIPEVEKSPVWYGFVLGRGAACRCAITRRLEDGCLPILHSRAEDGDIQYDLTAFATLERSPLTAKRVRGTHFLVADGHGAGHMFTPEQEQVFTRLRAAEEQREEEVILCVRAVAVNTAAVPRYAWFKNVHHGPNGQVRYDGRQGFGVFVATGRVYSVSRLNGGPLPQNEVAVLLPPGGQAVFEFFLPHQPVPRNRASALAKTDFEARHRECRVYWRAKLATGAGLELPEPVIDEMVKAGLLHLDLVAYGREPQGPVAATIGVYCPIGSESAPIIQFFDAMGWHGVAERALEFFLAKQHKDGFIQNFGNYMLETGPALWTMGEHYRYTRDTAWVRRIKPKLLLACEFMLNWRRRHMTKEWRGRGYGMQAGKVGDPEDHFHIFMLNGYACLGMRRVAEMLQKIDPAESRRWAREALAFRRDIRRALAEAVARAPVVPLADGTWVPSAPPWAEAVGPVSLFAEPGQWWTHGTFTARDSLVNPLYLVFQEVLAPDEPVAEFLVQWHSELYCVRNVALSQPFYARHDFAHLRRGEVKPFLKTYYNGLTGLADRETYSWWEHYFGASPHKTHEEAWFLMQTRWMLWMEEAHALCLLRGIPRAWLEPGRRIQLRQVATYFGPLDLEVESLLDDGRIEAKVRCQGRGELNVVTVRLPHPQGRKAVTVEGGRYDPATETVRIAPFRGQAGIIAHF